MPTLRIFFSVLLILAATAAYHWFSNPAENAGPDVPSGKLVSLSFAPFREGYSPLRKTYPLPEHIDEDLGLLADKVYNVRTYSSRGGMQPTPEMARKHHLTMLQGAWLGNGAAENRLEIEALIASANANPDVVKRVIVGNEVLLRRDLNVDELIEYIREVKRSVQQPVSYADVWSMYMKYPQLMKEVDFVTIHILPYWEDEPVAIDHAGEHLEKIVKQIEAKIQEVSPGKSILIGETGWPGAGRQRGMAAPGVVNEAKFIRDLIQVANRHGFDYNIVEAFNQSWKSDLEGVVGANWGLLSVDRKPIFPLTGPVMENPNWIRNFVIGSCLWLIIAAAYFKPLQTLNLSRTLLLLALAQLSCLALVNLADYLWFTSYSFWQRTYTVAITAANAVIGLLFIRRCGDILQNRASDERLRRWLGTGYLLFAYWAILKTLVLSYNGRYLSFPIEQFAVPALGILGLLTARWLAGAGRAAAGQTAPGYAGLPFSALNRFRLAYLFGFAIPAMLFGEIWAFLHGSDLLLAHPQPLETLRYALLYTFSNQQLLLWALSLAVLALPVWTSRSAPKRGGDSQG